MGIVDAQGLAVGRAPAMEVDGGGGGCQCKGVRACALCDHRRTAGHRLNVARILRTFVFCPRCRMCFLVDPEGKQNDDGDGVSPSNVMIRLPGIAVVEEAVSEAQELLLEENIERTKWVESQSGRFKQDFGPKVNFKKQKVKFDTFFGFPSYMSYVMDAFSRLGEAMVDFEPVELCNLKYSPNRGSCIDPHFDDWWLWGERLATLNLRGDTVLTFSRAEDFNDLTNNESPMDPSNSVSSSEDLFSGLSTEDICTASRTHRCSSDRRGSDGVSDGGSAGAAEGLMARAGDVVHVALPRRSVVLVEKDARFKWHHSVLREHITETRLAMTIRELSDNFRNPSKSKEFEIGKELLAKAQINSDL